MASTAVSLFDLDDWFVRDLPGLYEPWQPAAVPAPELLVLNDALAAELGLDGAALRGPDGVAVLVGNAVPEGATPVAQAYSGHQFGGLSPRLGDGRALLLGELTDAEGRRRDLHLKGSGRTPFARGGDGKAAVGPMLREHVISEAMHALGIPTTRALSVVATGEQVARETMLPGAVLARVAASHLRVGTFQYAAMSQDPGLVARLADHAIARHHPAAAHAERPALALLDAVLDAQASLVARWMHVGFVHGVMNTDNTTISGETIDYGPCAFLDAYDPGTVFSSIDHGGRYAFGNQAPIAQWNLARLAEALLPLIDDDQDAAVALATESLHTFPDRFRAHWAAGMRAKLGIGIGIGGGVDGGADGAVGIGVDGEDPGTDADLSLFEDLLELMHAQQVDHTTGFRAMSAAVRGDAGPARALFAGDVEAFDAWSARHLARVADGDRAPAEVAATMDRVNPIYIPRNHLVEEALTAATAGDLGPYERLVEVVTHPFDERPGLERYAAPDPDAGIGFQTFCGT